MEEKDTMVQLRKKFLQLYTKKEEIVTSAITSTYVLYTNMVGRAEFEVFNLSIEAKALRLKIKLAQSYINKNETPDTVWIENRISQLWHQHEEKLKQMIEGIKFSDNMISVQPNVVEDCRTIYRMLVKKLHPDLHPELSEDLHDMLIVAQAAYKQYDVKTLRQLAIKCHFLSESDIHRKDFDEHQFLIQLQEQIANLEKEIEEYENSFPLNYLERLKNKKWVEEQQKILQEQLESLNSEINKLREIYSLIIDES